MPLVKRSGPVLPPPPPTPPPVLWTSEPIGAPRATWIDPTGQAWELSGPDEQYGWFTRPGIGGWGANPVTIVTDPIARGGVSVRHQRAEPRRLTWPLHIYGDTHMQWLTRYRALMRAFTLTKRLGPGRLRIARPDGSVPREVECFYEDGFAGEPNENWYFANPVLTLFCPDGFWRDTEKQVIQRGYTSAMVPFLSPFLTVSSSQVLGESQVDNAGDVEAWPNWTITGPAAQLVATNETTGQSFTLTYNLLAGQTATITMTPQRPLVRGPAGQNIIGSLNWPGAQLWSLAPGINDINFELSGSGAGTEIELSFYRRYETA